MSARAPHQAPRRANSLAIAIPAFGRAETIANSVSAMAQEAREQDLDVAFYVSDDTPDSSVEDALARLDHAAIRLHYRRNSPSLRHDRNLIATLLWPDADYVWLMGSGLRARSGFMASVQSFLDDQDFLFLNSHADKPERIPALRGERARELLRDMLWHQARTGNTIYGRRVRDWVRARGDALKIVPDFPQLCVMLGFASENDATIGWLGDLSVESSGSQDPSYWRARAVDVFVDHWSAVLAAFPEIITPDQRARVSSLHSLHTNTFNTSALIGLRRSGQYRWGALRQRHFREAMHLPMWKLVATLALPLPMLSMGSAALGKLNVLAGRSTK